MVSFRLFTCIVPFAITMGAMVCAVPLVGSRLSVLPRSVYLAFMGQTAGYATNYLSFFVRLEGLGKRFSSDSTSTLSMDTFHNTMTKITSVCSSHSVDLDSDSKAITFHHFHELFTAVQGMANACTVLVERPTFDAIKTPLMMVDNDTSQFVRACSNAANLNISESVQDVDTGNLAKCFPKTAKLGHFEE
ncbi:hypothetical protein RHS04_08176 [Rhizoctonia solani]|uniref:Uncharacterized protein n=1 Tax=Rhizoctonia solani TaxID=456999 RepID=A0A8H7H0C6_9AGAM|nr:hypothetical protein RHS04_08176 [Rhizoctonia solani]